MLRKYYSVFGPAFRILDAVILTTSWLCAYYLRKYFPLKIMTNAIPPLDQYAAYSIVIVLLWGAVFSIANLYSSKRLTRRTIEAYQVLRAHTVSTLIFISLTYLLSAYKLSRGVFLYFFFMSSFLLVYARIILRNTLRRLRAKGYNTQKVLIVGTGSAASQVYKRLMRHPELGIEILGFISTPHGDTSAVRGSGLPVLGSIERTSTLIHELGVSKLLVALSRTEAVHIETVLSALKDDVLDIVLIPDIYEYVALGCEVEDFDGIPMVSLNETPIIGVNLFVKRVCDFILSFLALLILSPLMLVLALVIKFTSRGPIFYRQERMSLNGRRFKMLKFRSMTTEQAGDVDLLNASHKS
jgi:FlaA1/EpsC-like NDP-sugar epimerase